MQIGIAIGQKPHFEAFREGLDVASVGKQRRHYDQRSRLDRYALAVVQARQ
ncbi:hypothetical protein D9M71_568190 [compost metagenome]